MRYGRRSALALTGILVLSAPSIAGCGDTIQQGAERIAEEAVGGDVEIDEGGVTVQGDQGQELAIGSDVVLPDSWPATVPAFDGGQLVVVSVQQADANAMWTSAGTPEAARDQYRAALEAAGFVIDSESTIGGLTVIGASGNGYRVETTIGGAGGETSVTVTASRQ